jgi:eukaryotic-like serine/threonine-protein kinase
MVLSSGTKLGPYEIVSPLGAGGMGEVYRARDTRLGRDVALKVLPEAFVRDTERMARFEREAKVLASLNHPNIGAMFGIEESQDVRALVIELVEGPTLADRIKQGPIPIDDALPLAKQIAEALEYAHEHGIIHRDLKPLNVKLTLEDQVKVLDFGLAKAVEGEAEQESQNSPTLSAVATRMGVLLGTAPYMSPEQARGKRVDRRADIWAFGCVLYEMVTGRCAFPGETTSDSLAAVIRAEPDWSALPTSTPIRIRELLRRCLQKDARQRLRDIGDARIAIEEILTRSGTPEGAQVSAPGQPLWRRLTGWAAGILAGVFLASLVLVSIRERPKPRVVERLSVLPPVGEVFGTGPFAAVAFSPEGNSIVYSAQHEMQSRLYLRSLDRFTSSPLSGTDGAADPFFSPDGQWVGFFAGGKLKKVSVHGGEPVTLREATSNRGASWGPDDTILFVPSFQSGLMRVAAAGGTPQVFNRVDTSQGARSYRWPEILPRGKAVLFSIIAAQDIGFWLESKIAVERLDTHERKILPTTGTYPRYSPSGHLLYVRDEGLFAVPFDLDRLEVTGPPVPVLETIAVSFNSGLASFAVSRSGSLAYIPGSSISDQGVLTWIGGNGSIEPLGAPAQRYSNPRLSSDGQRIAVAVRSGAQTDVWVYEISHGSLSRLTFDGHSSSPIWTPDGKKVTFMRSGETGVEIVSKSADGTGSEESILREQSFSRVPESWSPDGKFLLYSPNYPDTGRDIFLLPLEGDRKPRPFIQTKFDEFTAVFSPDGHWVAYASNETGRSEIYVQPFPGPGGRWQVSTEGGIWPVWARDGRELFYPTPNVSKIMSVNVTTWPSFTASAPRLIANLPPSLSLPFIYRSYDVSRDGQRFLFLKANGPSAAPTELRVILNWDEELKRLAQGNKAP